MNTMQKAAIVGLSLAALCGSSGCTALETVDGVVRGVIQSRTGVSIKRVDESTKYRDNVQEAAETIYTIKKINDMGR
jgi:hypothetical protein